MALTWQVAAADTPRTGPVGDNIDDKLGQVDELTRGQEAAALRLLARNDATDLAGMLGLEASP